MKKLEEGARRTANVRVGAPRPRGVAPFAGG